MHSLHCSPDPRATNKAAHRLLQTFRKTFPPYIASQSPLNSVSPFGQNCARFLAPLLPLETASPGFSRIPVADVRKHFFSKKTFPPMGGFASSISLASTFGESSFIPLLCLFPTEPTSLGFGGSPERMCGNIFSLKKHFPPSAPSANGGLNH